MSYIPKDWSNLSYREVKTQLEEYRNKYVMKDKDFKNAIMKDLKK